MAADSETGNEARADDTDQGERLAGVHDVLYPLAIAVLKRGGGWGLWNQRWNQAGGPVGKSPCAATDYGGFDRSRPASAKLPSS
jgi:hypothetical protein